MKREWGDMIYKEEAYFSSLPLEGMAARISAFSATA
jgi:hypothetical protein